MEERSIEEWSQMLIDFCNRHGAGPYSFYELINSDIEDCPFRNINYETLSEVVRKLEREGRARYMNSSRNITDHGVKLLESAI